MGTPALEAELFRAEIERLLASPEFASSRQLQKFLRFTSEKALAGFLHLDQTEIAHAVLGRGEDFNPIEDAAVRKLASQVRHRLDQHYTRASSGEVSVILPVRSYIPRLESRTLGTATVAPSQHEPTHPGRLAQPQLTETRVFAMWFVLLGVATLAVLLAWGWQWRSHRQTDRPAAIVIWTEKGDISQGTTDAPGGAVRLGRTLLSVDEISVRLNFAPNREAQQAGLLVWQDRTHFLRFGRKFMGRNKLEFVLEENLSTKAPLANSVYDSEGQAGSPLWMAIRREENVYAAFSSTDGNHWEAFGEPLQVSGEFLKPSAGIYAFNGRRDAPSMAATFSELSTGITFATLPESLLEQGNSGRWLLTRGCVGSNAMIDGLALRLEIPSNAGACGIEFERPLEGSEWEISTKLDSFAAPGRSAGLRVQGSKASVRLARYYLNGPSIVFIHDSKTLVGVPDFNGSPALVLRLSARHGQLLASYSPDGQVFQKLPIDLRLEDLGGTLRAGVRLSTSTTDQDQPSPVSRFFYYRDRIEDLLPYRHN